MLFRLLIGRLAEVFVVVVVVVVVVGAAYSPVPGQHYYVYTTTIQSSWLVGNWTLIVPILLLGIVFFGGDWSCLTIASSGG